MNAIAKQRNTKESESDENSKRPRSLREDIGVVSKDCSRLHRPDIISPYVLPQQEALLASPVEMVLEII